MTIKTLEMEAVYLYSGSRNWVFLRVWECDGLGYGETDLTE